MYSLYRAHSTAAKGFHKRATQQGKQYKEAVPCSAEMDKIARYACLDTVAFTPRSAFRVNVFCWTWPVC